MKSNAFQIGTFGTQVTERPNSTKTPYAGHRFPPELISYTVWLYFRFPLSLRMVEEMLAFRGLEVSYETIRQWGSVLHGCAGWRRGWSVSQLRISPSCRINTMPSVATTFRGRSGA